MMMPYEAQQIIEHLRLKPLDQEGGFFLRTYASSQTKAGLQGLSERPLMTCIYFLITKDNFSAFHKVASDEIYHFYAGGKLELNLIDEDGRHKSILMGSDPLKTIPQYVILKNVWQGSRVAPDEMIPWSLIGATVCPGFDFDDFELGNRRDLVSKFPEHEAIIRKLTR